MRHYGISCPTHGFSWNTDGRFCADCGWSPNRASGGFSIIDKVDPKWCHGWYEHIDHNPIKIESKQHLINECNKRGMVARAFSKRKSQGKGLVHK